MSELTAAQRIQALQAKRAASAPEAPVVAAPVVPTRPTASVAPVAPVGPAPGFAAARPSKARTPKQPRSGGVQITLPSPARMAATGASVVSFAAMIVAMGPLAGSASDESGDDSSADGTNEDALAFADGTGAAQAGSTGPNVVVEVIPNYVEVPASLGEVAGADGQVPLAAEGSALDPANPVAPAVPASPSAVSPKATTPVTAPPATAAPAAVPGAPPTTAAAAPAPTAAPTTAAPAPTAAPTTAAPAPTTAPPPPKSEKSG